MNETKQGLAIIHRALSAPPSSNALIILHKKEEGKVCVYFLRLRASAITAARTMMMIATIATTSVRSGTACSTNGLVLGLGETLADGETVGAIVTIGVGETAGAAAATTTAPVSAEDE